jgi:hypothetical protein
MEQQIQLLLSDFDVMGEEGRDEKSRSTGPTGSSAGSSVN